MEIKRTSWHYKISNLGGFERMHDNLCSYFWRVIGKLVLFLVIIFILGFLIFVYCTSPFIVANTIMLLFIISISVLPPLAIYYLRKKVGKSPEIPYENIAIEYIKAKKRKICPLIKYV